MKKILLLCLIVSGSLFAQWEQSNTGLPTGPFDRITRVIYNDNGVFYWTNTFGYIAKSSDNGKNWEKISPQNLPDNPYINVFASIDNRLIVGLQNGSAYGVYYSEDGGQSFTEANEGFGGSTSILSLAVKDDKVYAGSSHFFVSTDKGSTWQSKSNGIDQLFPFDVNSIAFDESNNIYLGTRTRRVYKSTNDGEEWSPAANGLPNVPINPIIYNEGRLIAGTFGEGIYYSSDGGDNWTTSEGLTTNQQKSVQSILVIGNSIIAGTANGVHISEDNGSTWTAYNEGNINTVIDLFKNGNTIFAGMNNGVFKREFTTVGVDDDEISPMNYFLSQNYPNPFNPSTKIKFSIPEKSFISLKIFNSLGEEIATLVNKEFETGNYEYEWNAVNLPSGIYFYSLTGNNFSSVKKMTLLK